MAIDNLRMGGINSGYDTEGMIEQMLSKYQSKIDIQNQKLTKLSWQQEAYRDVTDKLTTFKQKYFDILNKKSYLLSPSSFNNFKSTISGKTLGEDAKGLSVSTTSSSVEGNYKIKLNQLATATKASGKAIVPEGFSLDLEKAAEANYTTKTDESTGVTTRSYEFALDVKVGDIAKTVEFKFDVNENADKTAFQDDFAKKLRSAFNGKLAEAFGYTGRDKDVDENVTGYTNPNGEEYFLQGSLAKGPKTMVFKVGGNAAVSVTEKTGNFGLTKLSKSLAISAQSAVTGTNTVAVSVAGGIVKNVTFDGVSDTYFDSRELNGNQKILDEYNALKEAAYREENMLSSFSVIDQKKLDEFTYTSAEAAKDKNSAALEKALNEAFEEDKISFSIDNGTVTAKRNGNIQTQFSMTSVEGGTLGLEKGIASNRFTGKTKLKDMGITGNIIEAVGSGESVESVSKYSFEINGKKIDLEENATINNLLDAVNKSGAGVTMSYSYLTNNFELTSNNLGSAETIKFGKNSNGTENRILKELGLLDATVTKGQNAAFEINGVEVYHNSNSYTTDNTTFKFTDNMKIGEEYEVNVSKSYDDIKQTIKDFVKDYNQLIDDVYGHIGTAPARDNKNNLYDPLTDAQKEEMDEKEIEKWETAAKKGVIYHDTTVTSIMSQIRSSLYNSVTLDDGSKFGLYNMGISTVSFRDSPHDDAMRGKLTLDEDKLDKAFEENADAVVKLFTDSENGIMSKVNRTLDNAVRTTGKVKGSLITKAGTKSNSVKDNYIYRQMESIKERINTLQDRYDAKEDYWWDVFTNLEKVMGDLNDQSAYLSNYLGGYQA